ncbi:MAG: hypothetical protein N3A58_04495 [Spirochaetes bacterium]|nr:hypothetical protein [Spirochaetota bacterium]
MGLDKLDKIVYKEQIIKTLVEKFSIEKLFLYLINKNLINNQIDEFINNKEKILNLLNFEFFNNLNLLEDYKENIIFSLLSFLFVFKEEKALLLFRDNLKPPYNYYSNIFYFALLNKFDFYLSEMNNLKKQNIKNPYMQIFHILYTSINELKINYSPFFILLDNKNINLPKEVTNFLINFLIKSLKFGTLSYLTKEFSTFKLIENDIINSVINLTCSLNIKELLKIEFLYLNEYLIKIQDNQVNDIIKINIQNLKNIENIKREAIISKNINMLILNNNYFPNINYIILKYKIIQSEILFKDKELIKQLNTILLKLIFNDPGYELYYTLLIYLYSITNQKEKVYNLFQKFNKLFNINLIENESKINLIKAFFILKDYKICKDLILEFKEELPENIAKIKNFIFNS